MPDKQPPPDFPALFNPQSRTYHPITAVEFIVGRNPGANLTVYDKQCSREQFAIRTVTNGLVLRPLSPRSPTRCNFSDVDGEKMLVHGDRIDAGDCIFYIFERHDPDLEIRHLGPRSVTEWIADLRAGDRDAVNKLWPKYYDRLVREACKRLRGTSARVSDEEDVASVAFTRCLKAIESKRYPDLQDRDGLWRLLVRITHNEARDARRYGTRQKRGPSTRGDSVFSDSKVPIPPSDEPTPEFAMEMRENVERLLSRLDSECREIATLKLEGCSNREIAEKLGCSEPTIERRLRAIREDWSRIGE